MLKVSNLAAGYGKRRVLEDISLEIQKREIAAIIGPNGAGKSTFLKAIMGLLPVEKGSIEYKGERMADKTPSWKVINGIGFVPQGNRVFTDLKVMENLEIGGHFLKRDELKERIEEVLNFFPKLRDREHQYAGSLSGGEKQMLALGRALIAKPELLLLDEPSLGLSPNIVSSVMGKLKEINGKFGTTLIIVEQKIKEVLSIAHETYIFNLGKIVSQGPPKQLLEEGIIDKVFFSRQDI